MCSSAAGLQVLANTWNTTWDTLGKNLAMRSLEFCDVASRTVASTYMFEDVMRCIESIQQVAKAIFPHQTSNFDGLTRHSTGYKAIVDASKVFLSQQYFFAGDCRNDIALGRWYEVAGSVMCAFINVVEAGWFLFDNVLKEMSEPLQAVSQEADFLELRANVANSVSGLCFLASATFSVQLVLEFNEKPILNAVRLLANTCDMAEIVVVHIFSDPACELFAACCRLCSSGCAVICCFVDSTTPLDERVEVMQERMLGERTLM